MSRLDLKKDPLGFDQNGLAHEGGSHRFVAGSLGPRVQACPRSSSVVGALLMGRAARVLTAFGPTEPFPVERGVVQGTGKSPILYATRSTAGCSKTTTAGTRSARGWRPARDCSGARRQWVR